MRFWLAGVVSVGLVIAVAVWAVVIAANSEVAPCTKTRTIMVYNVILKMVTPQVICVERAQ